MEKGTLQLALVRAINRICSKEDDPRATLGVIRSLGLEDNDIHELGFDLLLRQAQAVERPELQGVKTLKDLLPLNIECDVWDSETDDLGIALVGPTELTEEGARAFKDILDLPVSFEIINEIIVATVNVALPEDCDDEWRHRQQMLFRFLKSAAGYCSEETYSKYFKEV